MVAATSYSSMRYEPVPYAPNDQLDDIYGGAEAGAEEDLEGDSEVDPLVRSNSDRETSTGRNFLGAFFNGSGTKSKQFPAPPAFVPPTPISSDGVFANITAKPSSSRDHNSEDDDLGEDEWIFMTPEQRRKLAPPKYSKIKRDRSPRYTTEYTPPELHAGAGSRKSTRTRRVRPRVNSLPAGSSSLFIITVVVSTLLPILGFSVMYALSRGRWESHALRLGSHAGLGLGLFHAGTMIYYIPALVPGALKASVLPLVFSLLWTAFVGLPFGLWLARDASREYIWVKAQERVLVERMLQANLTVAAAADDEEDGVDAGYRYIEGTDIRVKDLRKILARARDARLARSLQAAGF